MLLNGVFCIVLVEVGTWSSWTEWSSCPACYKGVQPVTVQWADCGCEWFGTTQENMNCSCVGGEFVEAKPRFDICPQTACPGNLVIYCRFILYYIL